MLVDMSNRIEAWKTRQLILETAFHEIYKNGFRATGLNGILEKTGLTKGAFYHHFKCKNAIGYAILDELLPEFYEKIYLGALNECEDPVECLKEILRSFRVREEEVMLGCPWTNLAVEMSPVDEGFRLRIQRIYDNCTKIIESALERGKSKGYVREDIDSNASAMFIIASVAGCRSVAKNARSAKVLLLCHDQLIIYLNSLKN